MEISAQIKFWTELAKVPLFSPAWHRLLEFAMPRLAHVLDPDILPLGTKPLARAIINAYKNYSPDRLAFIDGFDGGIITGWAQKLDADPHFDLYIDDIRVADNVSAVQYREDVKLAGFGDGKCGFYVEDISICHKNPWCATRLVNPVSGHTFAVKFFNLCDIYPESRLLEKIEKLDSQGEYLAAYNFCLVSAKSFVGKYDLWAKASQYAQKLDMWPEADEALSKAAKISSSFALPHALHPLENKKADHKASLHETLRRLYVNGCSNIPDNYFPKINDVFNGVLEDDDNIFIKILYNNFVGNYLYSKGLASKKLAANLMRKKLLAIFHSITFLQYNIPWIKFLPNYLIDIVIIYKNYNTISFMKENELNEYKLLEEIPEEDEYSCLIIDRYHYYNEKNIKYMFNNIRKIFICHSVSILPNDNFSGLNIVSCENICKVNNLYLYKNIDNCINKVISNIPQKNKSEVTYTGPYHFGKYLKRSQCNKEIARK